MEWELCSGDGVSEIAIPNINGQQDVMVLSFVFLQAFE
jgi:hypothetical protein